MTGAKAILKLKKFQAEDDPFKNHEKADKVLCDLLKEIGYDDVVKEYRKIRKYYA